MHIPLFERFQKYVGEWEVRDGDEIKKGWVQEARAPGAGLERGCGWSQGGGDGWSWGGSGKGEQLPGEQEEE